MSQYKVIQDIEAEDKLLGPLSLRQFVYAIIVIVIGFIAFQMAKIAIYLVIPFLPAMVFFGLLAAPFGQTQSSEVWLLAKIRFFLFPKRRIWNQDGIQELVHITVPKKIEKHLTKGFSQDEVSSRLQALANTLDTRGWVIKNVTPDVFQRATTMMPGSQDRLIDIESMSATTTDFARPEEDVLDPSRSQVAQHMGAMLQESEQQHRQSLISNLRNLASQKAPAAQSPSSKTASAQPTADDTARMVTTTLPGSVIPTSIMIGSAAPAPQTVAAPAVPAPAPPANTAPAPQTILNNTGLPLKATAPAPTAAPTPAVAPVAEKAQAEMTKQPNTDKIQPVSNRDSIAIDHGSSKAADDNDEVVISLH